MISLTSAVSTPNLYKADNKAFLIKERDSLLKTYANSTRSLTKLAPVKNIFESYTKLNKSISRGSNIMITTSFVNLSQQPNGSNKNVYFRPVVSSEVSWEDSGTTSDGEVDDDTESSDSGKSLTPPIEVLVQRLRGSTTPPPLPSRRRPTIADRRRLAEDLNKLKLETERKNSIPVNHMRHQTLQQRGGVDAMKPQKLTQGRRNVDSPVIGNEQKHERSSLFELFTFGLLSGRKKKNEKKIKNKSIPIQSNSTTVVNNTVPVVEDFRIIPLHPPKDDVDQLSELVTIV